MRSLVRLLPALNTLHAFQSFLFCEAALARDVKIYTSAAMPEQLAAHDATASLEL
jgi:hypothetical protein